MFFYLMLLACRWVGLWLDFLGGKGNGIVGGRRKGGLFLFSILCSLFGPGWCLTMKSLQEERGSYEWEKETKGKGRIKEMCFVFLLLFRFFTLFYIPLLTFIPYRYFSRKWLENGTFGFLLGLLQTSPYRDLFSIINEKGNRWGLRKEDSSRPEGTLGRKREEKTPYIV